MLKRVLDHLELPTYLYAFERGRNVVAAASVHVGKPLVMSIDIRDFFPSVKVGMVSSALEGVTSMSKEDCDLAAELTTYKYFLPQGGVTSPKVSNLIVANTFGEEVKKYCIAEKLNLTIYADDVTVSSDVPTTKDRAMQIYADLSKMLLAHGFKVKAEKTKFMLDTSRQTVCGIVVNEKLNLDARTRRLFRSMVHHYERGIPMTLKGEEVTPSSLKGRLSWYAQLGHPSAKTLLDRMAVVEASQNLPAG